MTAVYILSLLAIAGVCALGVLHPRYEDTLTQRIGLAVACLGAVAELAALLQAMAPLTARPITTAGVALFALGTVLKKWRGPCMRRRATDKPKGQHPCN